MNLENGDETDGESTTRTHSGLQRAALIMTAFSTANETNGDPCPHENALLTAQQTPKMTTHIEVPAKQPSQDRDKKITKKEWRLMLETVRHLPRNRGTILLMPFRQCVGKESFTVSAKELNAIKHARIKSVQTLQQLITEMNERFRRRHDSTPFTILRNPTKGLVQSYMLTRWKAGAILRRPKKDPGLENPDAHAAENPAPQLLQTPAETTTIKSADNPTNVQPESLMSDPESSDLTSDDWKLVESFLAQYSASWKWHRLLEAIWKARPQPVSLAILDAIGIECGNKYPHVWGIAFDKLNLSMKQQGAMFRIMKKPSERISNTKSGAIHNVYAGNVTLYRFDYSASASKAAGRKTKSAKP